MGFVSMVLLMAFRGKFYGVGPKIDQTNNDPWYIAKYYYDYISSHHGENCIVNLFNLHERPRVKYCT